MIDDPTISNIRHPPPCAGLILLGTVHFDPRGFQRACALLDVLSPDLVMVEISPFSLEYRKQHAAFLRKTFFGNLRGASRKLGITYTTALKHARAKAIIRQISLPFEYRASISYARRTGIEVIPVDCSEFSREWIETWKQMVSAQNLESLVTLESAAIPAFREYRRAALGIAGGIPPPLLSVSETDNAAQWQKREEHIAAEIRSACKRLAPERPVYIGGWRHLLSGGSPKTIREILSISPERCRLIDRGPTAMTRYPGPGAEGKHHD